MDIDTWMSEHVPPGRIEDFEWIADNIRALDPDSDDETVRDLRNDLKQIALVESLRELPGTYEVVFQKDPERERQLVAYLEKLERWKKLTRDHNIHFG